MSDYEITALILLEHEAFRRDFTNLDAMTEEAELSVAWTDLANALEVHASGEEEVFYPHLVHEADADEETEHAIHDHNEIRDAARAVEPQEVGSEAWWEAVRTAREVNAEHMEEEERDIFPTFRESVDAAKREELGLAWLKFHDDHENARGLSGEDKDPAAYVEEHSA